MIEVETYLELDVLILSANAGPVNQLAITLGVEERTVKHMIEKLRIRHQCPINYNPSTKSYYYALNGRFVHGFQLFKVDAVLEEIEKLRKQIEVIHKR